MKLLTKSGISLSLMLAALLMTSCYAAHTGAGDSFGSTGGSGSTSTTNFSIGGNVSGLTGSGLVLQDNGGDNLTIAANGPFTFKSLVATSNPYVVTVLTQPTSPSETCFVGGGSGTASANVTSVQITCSVRGANVIGGQVTGLLGSGLVLQDNGADNLTVKANGSFNFATTIPNGSPYAVTVAGQPSNPTQTCTVGNGSGTASGNVGNVVITCSLGTLSLGGSVSGLAGSGLVLANTNGDTVSISKDGSFTFPVLLVSGAAYNVSIKTQPTAPGQTCTISNNTGTATANVSNLQVVCPAVFYSVGGEIVGLYTPTGQLSNMVIQNNGGDNLPITGNGAFTFVTPIANGSAYDVSTLVQPNSQIGIDCRPYGWNGIALSNVTDVMIDCGHNDWTWMDGPNTSNKDKAVTPAPVDHTVQDNDTPGGSKYSATWTDLAGNLWLLTGSSHALDHPNIVEFFGEMWEYTGTHNYDGGLGNYWTLVAPKSGALPTPRWGAVSWTDSSGLFWLFGGQDAADNFLNDLWTYNSSTNTWTAISGASNLNANGTYGSIGGVGYPGGRWGATATKDASGNVWLFGGFGFDTSSANPGLMNDLWKFSGGQWTWVNGSNLANQNGVYGAEGTAASSNVPGGRQSASSWVDNSGNFWIFGGFNLSPTGQPNAFNDLWQFSGGQWTWMSGSNSVNQTANFGTEGVAAATNVPGARWNSASWSDASGNFWLFGGFGYDATGDGTLGDLWEYKGGGWIWVKGPSSVSQSGDYGTQPNPIVWPHVTNYPGSRWGASYWTGPFGFWMFGGEGFDSSSGVGDHLLNDLWRYLPYP